jgi:hypothetical protein
MFRLRLTSDGQCVCRGCVATMTLFLVLLLEYWSTFLRTDFQTFNTKLGDDNDSYKCACLQDVMLVQVVDASKSHNQYVCSRYYRRLEFEQPLTLKLQDIDKFRCRVQSMQAEFP